MALDYISDQPGWYLFQRQSTCHGLFLSFLIAILSLAFLGSRLFADPEKDLFKHPAIDVFSEAGGFCFFMITVAKLIFKLIPNPSLPRLISQVYKIPTFRSRVCYPTAYRLAHARI
jgi:hypothetical protein